MKSIEILKGNVESKHQRYLASITQKVLERHLNLYQDAKLGRITVCCSSFRIFLVKLGYKETCFVKNI
jgi:hypothetical protein